MLIVIFKDLFVDRGVFKITLEDASNTFRFLSSNLMVKFFSSNWLKLIRPITYEGSYNPSFMIASFPSFFFTIISYTLKCICVIIYEFNTLYHEFNKLDKAIFVVCHVIVGTRVKILYVCFMLCEMCVGH